MEEKETVNGETEQRMFGFSEPIHFKNREKKKQTPEKPQLCLNVKHLLVFPKLGTR